jgi:4-nitrophenyl phosphatase
MKLPKDKKVYVIGMAGIEEELREEGVSFIGGTVRLYPFPSPACPPLTTQTHTLTRVHIQDPADCTLEPFSLSSFSLDPDVRAVLCGLDLSVNYTKLSKAFQYLTRNPGCQFLVTNEDSTFPSADGLLPGAGAISAPLRFALERDPISIGKPAKTMLDCIQAKYVSPSELAFWCVLLTGDDYEFCVS